MPSPFFIIGASRSGTTLLRLMLNAHSSVYIPDEMNYFHWMDLRTDLSSWRIPRTDDRYRHLVRTYLHDRSRLFSDDLTMLEARILETPDRTLRGPYRTLLEHGMKQAGSDVWGEKTPRNLYFVDILHEMFPDGRFLHVIRDPRAVTHSMSTSPYYSNETVFNALNWRRSIRRGVQLLHQHVPRDRYRTVRYEDLVQAPEASVKAICSFLELSFEREMMDFYKTSHRHIHQKIQTPSVQQPVNQKSLDKWKTGLSEAHVRVVERLCASEMRRFGYAPVSDRTDGASLPLTFGPKLLYWKWKSWQHRHQRGYELGYPFLARTRSALGSLVPSNS